MPLGGSQRTKNTSGCNIFLQNVIITKEKTFNINGKENRSQGKVKTSARK
jgi:hypothetical protein